MYEFKQDKAGCIKHHIQHDRVANLKALQSEAIKTELVNQIYIIFPRFSLFIIKESFKIKRQNTLF